MSKINITQLRLHNQQITKHAFAKAEDVVCHLGAVQAQDYAAAKWAVGVRLKSAVEKSIDEALDKGTILRTHILRPTWHFVCPADIRWMLTLTAPRVMALIAYVYRMFSIDAGILNRSNDIIAKVLQGGKQLTRAELQILLNRDGIATDGLRLAYLIFHAELNAIICSGGRQGKQFTYALFDERVAETKPLHRDEALAQLAIRYFTSRGPASLQDFVWWSGLTTNDAKSALEMIAPTLECRVVDGIGYWFAPGMQAKKTISPSVYLLPNFDEYVVGYADRKEVFDIKHQKKLGSRGNVLFTNIIVIDGMVEGTWKRSFKKNTVAIELHLFNKPAATKKDAVAKAAHKYATFLGLSPILFFK